MNRQRKQATRKGWLEYQIESRASDEALQRSRVPPIMMALLTRI
jgi:hypothetical protein